MAPIQVPKIPPKYMPRGFQILHEDRDLIVGNKAAGLLTVAALWEKSHTAHQLLNQYVRKGNPVSKKSVFVVHRLDQATTGVLIFAKSEPVQIQLKRNWKETIKTYYAIVHGQMAKKSGLISSYLSEDDDYVVHGSANKDDGKLAETEYEVLAETPKYSLLKINLLTGRKNQIRVHMAESGHPVVGDTKYGVGKSKVTTSAASPKTLALHSGSLEFTHPFTGERLKVKAPVPEHFYKLVKFDYGSLA